MSIRGLSQAVMTWMYLSLCGAIILLAHDGVGPHFWILLGSAATSWLGLHLTARLPQA